MHDLHGASWYASRVTPFLPSEAFKPLPQRLLWGVLYMLTALVATGLIGALRLSLLANLGLSLVVAVSYAGLGFLGHEVLHGTVIRTAWLRDLLGAIAFAQFSLGPKLWRKWHNMEHHAHTQHEDTDPDAMGTMEAFFRRPALRFIYRLPPWVRSAITFAAFFGYFSVTSVRMLRRYFRAFHPRDRVVVLMQFALPTLLWLMLLAWMGPLRWLFAYLIPLMLANFLVIAYISTNHQLSPLVDVNDPLANSLTVRVPRWMDVLHLNFSHHVEHHLFPGMNPKWAPLVKVQLKRLWPDRYQELPFGQALLALWRTPRLYRNHTELVDPHRGIQFGSLGNGLDPRQIKPRPIQH